MAHTLQGGETLRAPKDTSSSWGGLGWLVVALVGMFLFFWDGIVAMVLSWAQPEYSFGPLVPLVSAYMLLHEMRVKPPVSNGGSRIPGLAIAITGILVGILGNLTQIPYLIAYGFIIVIGGIGLIISGFRQGLSYWPGWVHLLFMLPLPNFIYWQLSGYLQRLSSRIGVEFIQGMSIPVFLDGNIIDLGVYQLHVAEACSGLRYLFPLMSFGYLFAVLYRGPLWQKLTLFFLTIPITIVLNSFRIGVIGVLVHHYGIGMAEGFLHFFEGWVIFIACVIILYIAGLILQRLRAEPASAINILDLEFDGILKPLSWARNIPASVPIIAVTLLLFLASAALYLTPERTPAVVNRERFDSFPMTISGWTGRPLVMEAATAAALGADDYLLADYTVSKDLPSVNLFISYYDQTADGTGIHSPEICIPGSGWEVSRWQELPLDLGADAPPFTVNRAIIQKGTQRQLVYYWFEQRGRRLASEYETKFYTVWDLAQSGRGDGALVRVITMLPPGEPDSDGDARLKTFLKSAVHTLPQFIPN